MVAEAVANEKVIGHANPVIIQTSPGEMSAIDAKSRKLVVAAAEAEVVPLAAMMAVFAAAEVLTKAVAVISREAQCEVIVAVGIAVVRIKHCMSTNVDVQFFFIPSSYTIISSPSLY